MAKDTTMNIKDIQNLIRFVAKSGASEVDLEMDGVKITIKTPAHADGQPEAFVHSMAPQPMMSAMMPQAVQPAPAPTSPAPAGDAAASGESTGNDAHLIEITSPMIGTFYRRPSPDKPLFVNVGDDVNEGDVVCIIEAMKLFNEIESEVSGKIVKILVEDSSPVEYGQPLYLVDPS